jgi:hypothetical protein
MKIDPYKHKEKYLKWKERVKNGIPEMSRENSNLILQYLNDMERGVNIAQGSVKGARSYIRLNSLKTRMVFLLKQMESKFGVSDAGSLTEEQILDFFSAMRSGELRTRDGRRYKSVSDYAKIFKAFWHWYQKASKKQGKEEKRKSHLSIHLC